MGSDLETRAVDFVRAVTSAMGFALIISAERKADSLYIKLDGEQGQVFLERKGFILDALQHIVNAGFRGKEEGTDRRIVIDCLDFRKNRDEELRQKALFLASKTKETGLPQEIGPLNPYDRRLVHLAIAEDPTLASESVGDAFLKTIVISTMDRG